MKPIRIHKGDSTVFANVSRFLTFNIDTELDLIGYSAKFILCSVIKTITDIKSRKFDVILTSEETQKLREGLHYGSIVFTDNKGNTKTVINTIPFEVTTAVVENEYQEIDLTIPESSGVDIKLKVGVSYVTSVNGMVGDVVIDMPSLDGYVKDTDYANQDVAGVVKTWSNNGISISNGTLYIVKAKDDEVTAKTHTTKPIVPANLDLAVKTGVTTNTLELTSEEKANAKAWLGYATPTDIMQAIASIPQFKLSIVEELPLAGEKMTLYLVPKEGTDNDVYDEYIWIEQTSSFEHLGTTAVDLTDYVKNTDYADRSKGGIVKASEAFNITFNSGIPACLWLSLEQYATKGNNSFISKGTLDNVLTQYSKTVLTTEADYNALATKDANTLYLIEE